MSQPVIARPVPAPAAGPSPIVQALVTEVRAAITTLEALEKHRDRLGEQAVHAVSAVVQDNRRRLGRRELYVSVVGEKKVGKSTFLNALLGTPLLGAAVRECTGTVTFIRHGQTPDYRARMADGKTEEFSAVAPDRTQELSAKLHALRGKLAACETSAKNLPTAIEQAQTKLKQELARLAECETALKERTEFEGALGKQHGEAVQQLDRDARQLEEAGKLIPFYYRSRNHWWAFWIWMVQWIMKHWALPQWIEHHERLWDAYHESQWVKSLETKLARATRDRERAEAGLATQRNCRDAARQTLDSLQKSLAALPDAKVQTADQVAQAEAALSGHQRERLERFYAEVKALTDLQKRGGNVEQLELVFPARWLPPDLVIIDTPGVNTDNETNVRRAWNVIRGEADGCIVLSDIRQPVSQTTRDFVREVREMVPHLLLILTKIDKALEDAEMGDGSAEEQVQEARQVGERRFANDVGRDPSEILAFAIAAERALRNDDPVASQRFADDVARILAVLHHERALMTAARCAAAIRHCAGQIGDAHAKAEDTYRQRIQQLTAQQIPNPGDFCNAQLRQVDSGIAEAATEAIKSGCETLAAGMQSVHDQVVQEIMSQTSASNLKSYVEGLNGVLARYLQAAERQAQNAMAEVARQHLVQLAPPLTAALRQRYQIAQQWTGRADRNLGHSDLSSTTNVASSVNVSLEGAISQFNSEAMGGALGGAAAGALLGSFIPGLGTIVGGLVGGVLGLLMGPSLDKLKAECAEKVSAELQRAAEGGVAKLAASERLLAATIRDALAKDLDAQVRKFGRWINDLITDQQRQLAAEQQGLAHLIAIRSALLAHEQRLGQLMESASNESRALVRQTARG